MRKICFLIILSAISLYMKAHEEPSKTLNEQKEKEKARERIAKSGIVKSTTWKYTVNDGKISEKGNKSLVQEFDKSGKMIAIEAYKNDSLSERVEYSFDLNNNMLTDIDYSPNRTILEKNIYKYDNEGRLISGNCYDEKEQITEYFLINKEIDKKSITFLKYKSNDTLVYKLEYLYASDFDKSDYVQANKYDLNNKILMRVIKKYNSDGLQTEKAIYGGDLSLSYIFYYEYYNDGNISSITKKKSDGTIDWKDFYSYDKNGNCMEIKSYDSNDKLKTYIKYTYEYKEQDYELNSKLAVPKVLTYNPHSTNYQEIFDGEKDSVVFYSGVVTILPKKSGHAHNTEIYEEMIVVLEGQGQVKITNQKNLDIKYGNIAFIPPNTEHQVFNTGSKNFKYIYIATKSIGK